MRQLTNPPREEWNQLCTRPGMRQTKLDEIVLKVYEQVKQGGDSALCDLTKQYDNVTLNEIKIIINSIGIEGEKLDSTLRTAIDMSYENIKKFHEAQFTVDKSIVETTPGVRCWREARPIESVGLYVPGGTAPLISTMLMLGVPAMLAACKEIVVCTPPNKDGSVNPAIRYSAAKCGIRTIYTVGGAQAIAAMVIGTETIPKVSKVFGPGNQYVTAAKQMAERYGAAIDMPAGPSEVLVVADDTARADLVAADLLSQAEHGTDTQVVLLITSRRLQKEVKAELARQLRTLPRREIATVALQKSLSILFSDLEMAFDFANEYAPEHIIVQTANAASWASRIVNAGSVFLGEFTPESAGDYASGTNHTLPTGGWGKSYAGVSLASFQRMVTFQSISQAGLANLANVIVPLAQAEGLQAHARAVTIRITPNS